MGRKLFRLNTWDRSPVKIKFKGKSRFKNYETIKYVRKK